MIEAGNGSKRKEHDTANIIIKEPSVQINQAKNTSFSIPFSLLPTS